ncbi:MAG: uroporphyrinogen-III C-methyltransferase [Roseburia sp.]|nr:uroporphyrinogen-III C-methyltransferase [Roseburia sp.]
MAGKVFLVGAGPGDVSLLTIRAKRLIESAQVIVYDSLLGKGILAMIPGTAESVDVGKRGGCHTMPQERINEILAEKAMEGKQVVRLKGGDPFLFGRGAEEAFYLRERGIPFQVVPGVTSALAVPAYAGIPVTHRDMGSMVHIITGHKKGNQPLDMDFEALAKAGGTCVFLMGVSALEEICQGLISGGMPGDTPAAAVSRGTTAAQKEMVGTLKTLPGKVKSSGLKTPAVIVTGSVCTCMEALDWKEYLPLSGRRIVITRPRKRSLELSERLKVLGAEVIELPAICTVFREENKELECALRQISSYEILAFTSPTGVEYFFRFMKKMERDVRCLFGIRLAAIGEGTAGALRERGIFPDYVPKVYDGRSLGILLREVAGENAKILLPRAKEGSRKLTEELAKRKDIKVSDIPLYDTVFEKHSVMDLGEEIMEGEITEAVFTSESTVKGFAAAASGADLSFVTAYCIGEKTAEEASTLGMRCVVAKEATVEALVDAVCNM